jgi:probable O-glycosylation ligase (exosortase A-associated)
MLKDNNDFALALAMGIPMMWHIASSEKGTSLRRLFFLLVPMTGLTIMMTHSRGGFLAAAVAVLFLAWRGRNRFAAYTSLGAVVLAGAMLAPSSYTERILSIGEYEEDASSRARLKAWGIAREMIVERPLFGVGFAGFEREYARFDPEEIGTTARRPEEVHVAHNSYLQIWAECGTLAFTLYLILIVGTFWDLRRIRIEAARRYHSSWILNYASMFEASLAAFVVGCIFLNRAHFDLFYHWVALVVAFTAIARRHLAEPLRYPTRPGGAGKLRRVEGRGLGMLGVKRRTAFGGGA